MAERLVPGKVRLDGWLLGEGVRQASARSGEPILGIAKGSSLAFVAVSGLRLVTSWSYDLPAPVERPAIFIIPPMIVRHLLAVPAPKAPPVNLYLEEGHVTLVTCDELGSYELRWGSDPRSFAAPPQMARLLTPPTLLTPLDYLEMSDAVHQAVLQLLDLESHCHIHRTRLAISVSISDEQVKISGQEIRPAVDEQYYFDPRLVVRALELTRGATVELGLTSLDARSAFLSVVSRQERCIVHCALLSVGLETQLLYPLPGVQRS